LQEEARPLSERATISAIPLSKSSWRASSQDLGLGLDEGRFFTAISVQRFLASGSFSVQRILDARSRAEPPNRNILGQALRDDKASGFSGRLNGMTILGDSVGANGCSPEEAEALSQTQDRRQKGASLLTQASHFRWPVFASQRPVPATPGR